MLFADFAIFVTVAIGRSLLLYVPSVGSVFAPEPKMHPCDGSCNLHGAAGGLESRNSQGRWPNAPRGKERSRHSRKSHPLPLTFALRPEAEVHRAGRAHRLRKMREFAKERAGSTWIDHLFDPEFLGRPERRFEFREAVLNLEYLGFRIT